MGSIFEVSRLWGETAYDGAEGEEYPPPEVASESGWWEPMSEGEENMAPEPPAEPLGAVGRTVTPVKVLGTISL